ncbi:hypothetical protein [Parapedobacter tibetensis]|uniref:hypothetical protein n=1 Tax=Parapedobacter tibetensis TaxID=2972951 RepID=UPI00214DD5D3|nr:hypothetical protein [Parapedobacter tibetensis]
MNEEEFEAKKKELISIVAASIHQNNISGEREASLIRLLEILYQYSFENRFQVKGLLSHTIVDSLNLEYSLGEKIIKFDHDI